MEKGLVGQPGSWFEGLSFVWKFRNYDFYSPKRYWSTAAGPWVPFFIAPQAEGSGQLFVS